MCGITGVVKGREGSPFSQHDLTKLFHRLLLLSEARGKEACGMALCLPDSIAVRKAAFSAGRMLATRAYKQWLKTGLLTATEELALIGHARLATNGVPSAGDNNQPICRDDMVMVHNGIIVNYEELWAQHPELSRQSEVDTEILVCLLRENLSQGLGLAEATRLVYERIRGVANIAALLCEDERLLLATNSGSLYLCRAPEVNLVFFASEAHVVQEAIRLEGLEEALGRYEISQIPAGRACSLSLITLRSETWSLNAASADVGMTVESVPARTLSVTSDGGSSAASTAC